MGKASKRKRTTYQPQTPPPGQGPSGQLLMGLGLALAVVVIVVLVAGGGLGQPTGGTAKPSTTPTVAALDTARVKVLEDAANANPPSKAAMIELGNLYYDADRYPEAITWYSKTLKLEPTNTNVRTDMATAYFYSGDVTSAIKEGGEVLSLDPTKMQTLLNMGIWLVNQNQPNPADTIKAIEHWKTVIQLYPNTDSAKQAQELINKYKK